MNEDDLVTYLPLSKWGFDRYGITYSASITSEYENRLFVAQEGTWEHLFGEDYNYNNNLNSTVEVMENIADCREDLYVFTGELYKTVSYNKNVKECRDDYGVRIAKYCSFLYFPELHGKCRTVIEQTPAAFMMILADLTADFKHDAEDGYYQEHSTNAMTPLGHKVAPKYDLAKAQFCMSGIDSVLENWFSLGGMEHGHMMGTYYFLANDYKNKLEEK